MFYHISHMAQTISYVAAETNHPIIGAVISIIGESVSDELSEQLKDKAKNLLVTDEEKESEKEIERVKIQKDN
ncbi:hypothetical protein [Dialister succinatiphilus]|uniref:hypothetical protein n=1 Tax=Dialister succinatiphilus TaxID=487173 RepID=UPI003078E939